MSDVCYLCSGSGGKGREELRPYGEYGQPICFTCANTGSDEHKQMVQDQFYTQLRAASQQLKRSTCIIGSTDGPIPLADRDNN